MKINYNVTGTERKALVTAIGEILSIMPTYKGIPSYAYEIGGYTVDRDGTLTGEDNPGLVADLQGLYSIMPVSEEYDTPLPQAELIPDNIQIPLEAELGGRVSPYCDAEEPPAYRRVEPENATEGNTGGGDSLTIEIPREGFTDAALENLKKMVESKAALIKKALGIETLAILITDSTIQFPWFSFSATGDEVNAYSSFISAMCVMAKSLNRVNAIEKPCDNEKYAFRCYLLRLGFIGSEYKGMRKILLSKLSGNAAFKNGSHNAEGATE